MSKKVDQGLLHEAMDRTTIINNNLEEYVIGRKNKELNKMPKVKRLLKKASKLLGDAYVEMGQYMKIIIVMICSTFLFSCAEKGESTEKLDGTELNLPPELKGLKVYRVSLGNANYIYVGTIGNTVSTEWRSGTSGYNSVTVPTTTEPPSLGQTVYENDSIIIIKKK